MRFITKQYKTMENLVELYKGKEPRTNSRLVAKGFDISHRSVVNHIQKYRTEFEDFGALPSEIWKRKDIGAGSTNTTSSTPGKRKTAQEVAYFMNEEQFMFLGTLVNNSQVSVKFKHTMVKDYARCRKLLAKLASTRSNEEWQNLRKDGKAVYMQKTDVIKQFVDYATGQGSKSANMYYSNLAQMENRALFLLEQKYPNVREVLNIKQLMQVATADQIVEKALADGMKQELPYKEIYAMAKDRVIQFSSIIGKSLVIEMLETPRISQGV